MYYHPVVDVLDLLCDRIKPLHKGSDGLNLSLPYCEKVIHLLTTVSATRILSFKLERELAEATYRSVI